MKIAYRERDLCSIEFCFFFREAFLLWKVLEKLSTLDELHDEVDAEGFLENVVHTNDEWMVYLVENKLFDLQWLNRLVLDNNIFADNLHGVVFVL